MGVGGQGHAPAALPPGKRVGTHFTEGWVRPRTDLDGCGNDPRTVQPLASRYPDQR